MRHKKIPGKKTKGHKDPTLQQEQRENALKVMPNRKPPNLDQEVPKKLQLLVRAKNDPVAAASPARRPKEPKAEYFNGKKLLDSSRHMGCEMRLPGMKRNLKPVPVFKQAPGETKKAFFNRMDRTVKSVIERKDYERKFDVDVTDDPETGRTIVKDREKDELDVEMDRRRNEARKKKGLPAVKSKEEKRRARREKEKERRRKKKSKRKGGDSDDDWRGAVPASAAPFNPAGLGKNLSQRKPGGSSSLLLVKKLKAKGRDDPSLARKQMLKDERQKVIELYRKIRSERYENLR